MSSKEAAVKSPGDARLFGAALGMMFLSGAAALIYEVVWMRMLSRVFGVTVYAVVVLVAIYMAGLALGAAAAARFRGERDWLRVYAWLEAGAGALALICTALMVQLPSWFARWAADAPMPAWARALWAIPVLLPPTVMLGATLPVLTSFWARLEKESGAKIQSGVGLLYGLNTLGAMTGLAGAAFGTIGIWGERTTVLCAATLNGAAAVAAFALSGRRQSAAPAEPAALSGSAKLVLWLFALSGFCTLGYEILWSRQLIPLLGNSTYAFSMVLIMYLGGIGLGSFWAARRAARTVEPLRMFGLLEVFLAAAALLSLALYRFIGLRMNSYVLLYSPMYSLRDFLLMTGEATLMILPASLLMGLLFPLAAQSVTARREAAGATVGRLYAFNTVGGILGSLAVGFGGMAWLGTHRSFLVLAALNVGIGLSALFVARGARAWRPSLGEWAAAGMIVAFAAYAWRDPTLEILKPRLAESMQWPDGRVLFHEESPAATTTGYAAGPGRVLLINGIMTSGDGPAGAIMAALPNALMESPHSTLVICFGAGGTFRAAVALGGEVDAVELVDQVPRHTGDFFPDAPSYLHGPNRRIFLDDGRNFLLRSTRRYDSIIVDAAPPLFSAGTVNLYTREFQTLAREHLTEQGIFALWLPLPAFEEDHWPILRAMTEVFPHVAVWNEEGLAGILCLGSRRPLTWNAGALDERLRDRGAYRVTDLTEREIAVGFHINESQLRAFLQSYRAVTDDWPVTEFPLRHFLARQSVQFSSDFVLKAAVPPAGTGKQSP